MRQRVLRWIAIVLLLLVGALYAGGSFTPKDGRIEVNGLFGVSVLCFFLALVAAHQRPKSN